MSCEYRRRPHQGTAVFYDERYASGYMEELQVDKKERIIDTIRTLSLPETGEKYRIRSPKFTK